ncbi:MAG: hypothetical protein FWB86_07520, partial [Treponema sp.]|nr:hypothetical protein [Treponema sp.]
KTTISNNGILSVASNETGTKITVQATSVFDNQKNGTADVSIIIIPPPKNWISIEGSIIGFGIRYERSLSTTFNLGLMFFLQMNDAMFVERSSFILDGGLLATFRFFPGNSIFFLEIGAGYGGNYDSGFGSGSTFGFMVYPAVGLQLGKKAKGIFFNAFFGVPIIIEGDRTTITNSKEEYDKFTSISIRYGIGLGYKW